jgi:hypothetical protein
MLGEQSQAVNGPAVPRPWTADRGPCRSYADTRISPVPIRIPMQATNLGNMKSLSVVLSFLLLVLAHQLAGYMRKTGALPAQMQSQRALAVPGENVHTLNSSNLLSGARFSLVTNEISKEDQIPRLYSNSPGRHIDDPAVVPQGAVEGDQSR